MYSNVLEDKLRNNSKKPVTRAVALAQWYDLREGLGLSRTYPRLLTAPEGNLKLNKGGQYGLCLLPHRLSGTNVCPHSTKECRNLCINWSGLGRTDQAQNARLARTRFLVEYPASFQLLLFKELSNLPPHTNVRLNVFSDIAWELVWPKLFTVFDNLQFYDYTKAPVGSRKVPANYELTYSASEKWTSDKITDTVNAGHNVAVVFPIHRDDQMIEKWKGVPVIDGDKNDSRYDDPFGVVVGLRAKGKAYKSDSPFVREI